MAVCAQCGNEADELKMVKIPGEAKKKKLCEDCEALVIEQATIAEASESVVQGMMDFKGRR